MAKNLFINDGDGASKREESVNRRAQLKPQRNKARQFKRGKLFTRVVSIILGSALFFGLVYLGMHWREVTTRLVDQFFFENPRFEVQHVGVVAQGPFPKAWMESIETVSKGTNIYRVDAEALRLEVKSTHSWIDQFQLNKDPGAGTIDIAIEARTPVGELVTSLEGPNTSSTRYFLDAGGVVFKISDPSVVRGINEPQILVDSLDVRDGYRARSDQTRLAGRFIQRFDLSSLGLVAFLDVVDARASDGLKVTLKGGGTAVFRSNDFDLDLEKWARILEEGPGLSNAAPKGSALVFPDRAEPFFASLEAPGSRGD